MSSNRKLSSLALALLAVVSAGSASAQTKTFNGATSDDPTNTYVKVGESDVNGGPHHSGYAGIGVQSTGVDTQVDFQGLATYGGSNAVKVLSYPYDPTSPHPDLGVFAFSKVGTADVWFGEWSADGSPNYSNRQVYYIGDNTNVTLPGSGTATYTVAGINQYNGTSTAAGTNLLTGTFTADFSTNHLSGSLTRTGSSTVNTLALGSVVTPYVTINPSTATFSGLARANSVVGTTSGSFFGANATALAGIATFTGNSQYNTAFGGTKN